MKNENIKTYKSQSQISSYKFFCRTLHLRECNLSSLNQYFDVVGAK